MEKEELKDMYAQKVADICRVPVDTVIKLREMGLLDLMSVRNFLIYHDYWVLKKLGKLTSSQIYEKLAMMYNVGKITAYNAVKERKYKKYYCRICGELINRQLFVKNDGICDRCIANNEVIHLQQ